MRFFILLAAICMQMCLGATYSWSVYVQCLKELTGISQSGVQVPFTVFYFVFPVAMMFAGRFLGVIGTRKSAIVGGILFGSGWIIAGQAEHSMALTVLGIGVVSGIGAGMAYIVPINVCVKWFPNSKGLVTGIAVAGFGGGAALVSQIGGMLLAVYHFSPFQVFQTLGAGFLLLAGTAGIFMVTPDGKTANTGQAILYSREIIQDGLFRVLYLTMVIGLAAGFAVNANLKELYGGQGNVASIGVMGVTLFAIANGVGRISWGWIFDRMDPLKALKANLFCQCVICLAAPVLLDLVSGFWLFSFLVGFNYGGVLVLFVSVVSSKWGINHVGQIYGLLFTSNLRASLAPILAGMVFDKYHSFTPALMLTAGTLLLGIAVISFNTGYFEQKSGALIKEIS